MEPKDYQKILAENERLKKKLNEAEKVIDSFPHSTVDIVFDKKASMQTTGDMQMYRLLIEKMNEGAAVVNSNYIILYANTKFARYAGRDLHKIIGTYLAEIIPSPAEHAWEDVLNLAKTNNFQSDFEVGFKSYSCSVASFQQNAKLYFSIIVADISEQKKAENALKKSERKWRTLIENIPFVISRFNLQRQYIYVNEPFSRLTGIKPDKALGNTPSQLFKEDVLPPIWLERLNETIQLKQSTDFFYDFKIKNEKLISMTTAMVPELDENNEIISVLAISKDITEDIKKDNQLIATAIELSATHKERKKLYDLFRDAPSIIGIVKGEDMIFEFTNKALEDAFPERELLGRSLYDVFPEIEDHPVRKILQHVITNGEPFTGEELSITLVHNGNEEKRVFDFTCQPDLNSKNEVEGIILYANDVTGRVKAHEQIEQQNRKLNTTNKYLDNFAHTIAHDLRSPLTNFQLIFAMFQESSEEEKEEFMQAMRKSMMRLENTLQGLISIIDTRGQEVQSEPLRIEQVIENTLEEESENVEEKNAEIRVEVEENLEINYVRPFLKSVLKNLLNNALKYSNIDRKPKIKIAFRRIDGYTVLSVSDNGIGIDLQKHRDLIFKPFKRINNNTGHGMGIGLHNIKTMVEKNGGKIEVESEPGIGSTFRVYLKEYD